MIHHLSLSLSEGVSSYLEEKNAAAILLFSRSKMNSLENGLKTTITK